MTQITRSATPGKFFGIVHIADTGNFGERYSSIAMSYTDHAVLMLVLPAHKDDFIRAFAHGQLDQSLSGTLNTEAVQSLKLYQNGTWYEIGEETGVNIPGATQISIQEQDYRHHEDFGISGFFDLRQITNGYWDGNGFGNVEVYWMIRAQSGNASLLVPPDSCRMVAEVWREFKGA